MQDSSEWLDTRTRAILSRSPPEKLAPPDAIGFSVVLLEQGPDRDRLQRALARVLPQDASPERVLRSRCPAVVRSGLPVTEAMLAQFELICADSVSVFVRDEVALRSGPGYRGELYAALLDSAEFRIARMSVNSAPDTGAARDYLQRFLGIERSDLPVQVFARWKKARIMRHWAEKIGVELVVPAA